VKRRSAAATTAFAATTVIAEGGIPLWHRIGDHNPDVSTAEGLWVSTAAPPLPS
jgi:hypothetical protein